MEAEQTQGRKILRDNRFFKEFLNEIELPNRNPYFSLNAVREDNSVECVKVPVRESFKRICGLEDLEPHFILELAKKETKCNLDWDLLQQDGFYLSHGNILLVLKGKTFSVGIWVLEYLLANSKGDLYSSFTQDSDLLEEGAEMNWKQLLVEESKKPNFFNLEELLQFKQILEGNQKETEKIESRNESFTLEKGLIREKNEFLVLGKECKHLGYAESDQTKEWKCTNCGVLNTEVIIINN